MARRSQSSHALTEHEEIRRWAEERGATPACVRGTGGKEDVGMIRLDFPGYSGEGSLEPIEWDEWFQKFDENNLTLLVQDRTAQGQKSNFNKLIKRDTAEGRTQSKRRSRSEGRTKASARSSARGRATSRASRSSSGSRSASARGRNRNTAGARKSARTGRSEGRSARSVGRRSGTSARGKRSASSTRKRSGSVRSNSRRAA